MDMKAGPEAVLVAAGTPESNSRLSTHAQKLPVRLEAVLCPHDWNTEKISKCESLPEKPGLVGEEIIILWRWNRHV